MILIPILGPIKYSKMIPDQVPQYVSRHMDDWAFRDTIKPWEQAVNYCNPWQYSDSIRQQWQSDVGPIRIRLIDSTGKVWFDDNFEQKQASLNMADMYIYESDMALSVVTEPGCYYIRIDAGNSVKVTFISEKLYLNERIENTLLLSYRNHKFYCDTVFEKGFSPSIRIYGRIKPKAPQAKDTVYEDQVLNMTIIDSKPFRVIDLQLSGPGGIPPYLIDKLNWILGCSTLNIDGRLYTKNEGAKFEEVSSPNYPMSGYSIEMREALNRSSIINDDTVLDGEPIAVVANTDSKGFGLDDSGGSIFQIIDVN